VVQIFGKRKRHAKTGRGTLTDVWDFWDMWYFRDISEETFLFHAELFYICLTLNNINMKKELKIRMIGVLATLMSAIYLALYIILVH